MRCIGIRGFLAKSLPLMKSDERILHLPQPIIDGLREMIRRIRRLQWIKGSLLTLAAAVAAVLVLMALDAALSLESRPLRLGLSVAGLGATCWVAWSYWLRPLCRRISLTAVARWVEARHPELQERLSTAVELLDDRHANDGGSRELLEAVVQDAVADVGKLDPAQDLSPRRTRPAKWLAGTAVGVLLVITIIWPGKIPRLLARAVVPMADTGNAWADRLRVMTKSQVVAIGDPLVIEAALSGKAERVELHLTDTDDSPVVEMLQPDAAVLTEPGESGYALRTPAVLHSFTAKVVAGKAVSAAFTITALPRPEPGDWTLTYDYPDYTGLPDEVKTGASGEISALTGTKVSARTKLNRPATQASVKIGGMEVAEVAMNSDAAAPDVTWSTVLPPNLNALWSLDLKDENGITNLPMDLPIRSVTDLPPVITLETPVEDRMELRPTEKLPLTYFVKEDIGLSAVRIRIRVQDKPEFLLLPETLPDKSPDTPDEYRGTAVLDLTKVMVPDGQEIRVALMAADRLPQEMQGPQRAYSREIVIRLNRWSRPLVEKNFEDQHQELRKKMEEVKRELYAAKGRMNDKPDRLKQEEKLSENTLKEIEASTDHLQQADALLKELTQRMKQTAYARQTPAMEKMAKEMVQPAQANTREIPLNDQKEARAELAKDTKDLLENAIREMEQEQQQMEQSRQAVQQVAKLSDIAEQQQRLAAEATQAPAGSPQTAAPPPATPPADAAVQNRQTTASDPPTPANPADPAKTLPAPAAPTDDEQRKWLEEQRRVAQRARELMEQNKSSNPQATQEQMKQAAAQAAQLAAEAEALAQKETQLAGQMAAAGTPQVKRQTAAAQEQIARQAAALQEKAKDFQEQSSKQINQSTETQSAAFEAQSQLEEATTQAQEAGAALTAAPQEKPAAASAQGGKPDPSQPAAGTPVPEAGPSSLPANPALGSGTANNKASDQPADPASQPGSGGNPSPAETASSPTATPAVKGQQAAQASSESLMEAAESLKSLGTELNSLAGMLADHSNSLGEGAQQAGTAADQAAKPQNEQGKGPAMQQGAQAAQQAADQLAMAANTMLQAMSIPASAKSSPASASSQGEGKPQNGQPQPAQPGQEGKDGMQMDTATGLLPAELAKLGLTQDDWMKLKSSLKGVDSAGSPQVPAEYRDLVKAYFGALAKGNPAK